MPAKSSKLPPNISSISRSLKGGRPAPAASSFHMVKTVLLDEKRMLPCAAFLNGEYGIKDVYMGVPVILGIAGVEKIIEIMLSKEEKMQFRKSYTSVKQLLKKLGI